MAGIERKLYQLIIARLDGERLSSRAYREETYGLVRKGIGGFVVFGGVRDELREFVGGIQSMAEVPLFIASDIEQGVGQQVSGTTGFPPQMAVAAAIDRENPGDVELLRRFLQAVADEAAGTGINMPLIPVLDVNQDPDNPIICTRAFSDSPEVVAWFGSEYVRTLEGAGLISCAKHFPGHGDSSTDSHVSLPVIDKPLEELMSTDVLPFEAAVRAGVSSIMVGHLGVTAVDPRPATLSEKIITGLLRTELSFDGLILTDALCMDALCGIPDVAAGCVEAGVDLLLHPADPDSAVRELAAALEAGRIEPGRVDAALERIQRFKARLTERDEHEVDYDEHAALSSLLAGKSITLVKGHPVEGRPCVPLLGNARKTRVVIAGEVELFEESHWRRLSDDDVRGAGNEALDTVVVAVFGSIAAWKGHSGIDETEKGRIREIVRSAKRSIVVSFGSPYVLRHFGDADILIAAYGASGQAQRAVVDCLRGEADLRGRLPVDIV